MTRDNALRKIKALLNTAAEGSRATDPERATAKALAHQLAARHGFKIVPRGEKPTPPPPRMDPFSEGVSIHVNGQPFSFVFKFDQSTNSGGFTTGW